MGPQVDALIPRIPNFDWMEPLGKELLVGIRELSLSLHQVNGALWVQGFLAGFGLCATVLTAIHCFSAKR